MPIWWGEDGEWWEEAGAFVSTYLRHHLLEIDVVADDGRVVAAQLEGDALQRAAAALHDLLAGEGRAGEADLVDARMLGEHGAQVVTAAQRLQHARREDARRQLDGLQRAVGRVGRRLPHERIARQQRRRDLADAQQQRPVPRHDANADAQRRVAHNDGPFVRVLDDLVREAQFRDLAQVAQRHGDLDAGRLRGLAGFLDQDVDEALLVGFDAVGEGEQQRRALVVRHVAPGLEGGAGMSDGLVDLGFGGDGHFGEGLLGAGVDGVARLRGRSQLVVDDILEGLGRRQRCARSRFRGFIYHREIKLVVNTHGGQGSEGVADGVS